jgi:hypothetical protein
MPINDDPAITDDAVLLRLLTKDWIFTTPDRQRPTSHALRESNFECSCFIDTPENRTELQRLYSTAAVAFAAIPARVLRENGFAIESRPDEAPAEFRGAPRSHVVVGPPQPCPRNEHERKARAIAKNEQVTVIPFDT